MKRIWLSTVQLAIAAAVISAGGCKPTKASVEKLSGETVPHYKELIGNEAKFDAAMLKCKELPTYDAMLNSEWCAVTRKAVECEQDRICPEK